MFTANPILLLTGLLALSWMRWLPWLIALGRGIGSQPIVVRVEPLCMGTRVTAPIWKAVMLRQSLPLRAPPVGHLSPFHFPRPDRER